MRALEGEKSQYPKPEKTQVRSEGAAKGPWEDSQREAEPYPEPRCSWRWLREVVGELLTTMCWTDWKMKILSNF